MRLKKVAALVVAFVLILSISMMLSACGSKVEELDIDATNAQTIYISGTEINTDGLVVTAKMTDGTTKKVPVSECEVIKPLFAPKGTKQVKVIYKGVTATYDISVATCVTDENTVGQRYEIRDNPNGSKVVLSTYLVGDNKPFVLIFPGGGYAEVYENQEGVDYAKKVNELGYNAFVLKYSVNMAHPAPLDDVAFAMRLIIANKGFFKISVENYAVCGSSAGGHLAATWSTKVVGYEYYGLPKPAAAILCYASTHVFEGGRSILLGENPTEELRKSLSADENIDKDYPPVYNWVFIEDAGAHTHTLMMKDALDEKGVENITRVFTGGAHGLGLAPKTEAEGWMEEAIEFWQEQIK